jgi:DNA-binding NtrC family response regulator
LFIDDLAAMDADLRDQLLGLLDGCVTGRRAARAPRDVRIIAGAGEQLCVECVRDAAFARLFYRLNVVRIDLVYGRRPH